MNYYEKLNQRERWISEVPVSQMTIRHLENAMGYMLRFAARWERDYTREAIISALQNASPDLSPVHCVQSHLGASQHRQRDPQTWVRSTRLYHALYDEWASRSFPARPLPPIGGPDAI